MTRAALAGCGTVVVKAGTSTVSNPDGSPSLVRLSGIVETVARLMQRGVRVILVSSGAVGCGRGRLRRQAALHRSLRETIACQGVGEGYSSASAAAGQLALMTLYATLFGTLEVEPSQFLVTQRDFGDGGCREHLKTSLEAILAVGMVPIVNENDAVSGNTGWDVADGTFSDNDGLAALVASLVGADLLVLLTDVEGLYDRPPAAPGARLVREVHPATLGAIAYGGKSATGRGGMEAKVKAALRALDFGVKHVVMASGGPNVLSRIVGGEDIGTYFSRDVPRKASLEENPLERVALEARAAARALGGLTGAERSAILKAVGAALRSSSAEILEANRADVAASGDVAPHLRQRLGLSPAKLETVARGCEALAAMADPVGRLLEKRELSDGLVLEKRRAPLGVVMVIFEARPEALPQIAALALRGGCAVVMKGGREAKLSNAALHRVVRDAVVAAAPERARGALRAAVGLLPDRDAVARLLEACDAAEAPLVDLVVPRGSNELVRSIQRATRVPVLGHADGVCHVYVDASADAAKAAKICVDAKCDYPAACNACETVLLHEATLASGVAEKVLAALKAKGVEVFGGPKAVEAGLVFTAAEKLKTEYGRLALCVEVVADADAAVEHINRYSSGHTECVVAEDAAVAEAFLKNVDSADVFHNASTRFADGFRFGLGAELGIATGRIHARGPVGVDGFLTYKWLLRSAAGHTVGDFAGDAPPCTYTHRDLPLE